MRGRFSTPLLLAVVLVLSSIAPASVSASSAADVAVGAGSVPVRLVQADSSGATLELVTPKFQVTPSTDGQALAATGCLQLSAVGMAQTTDAGRPQLPVKTVLIGAPAGAEMHLDVQAVAPRTMAVEKSLCAAPAVKADTTGGAADTALTTATDVRDAAIYSQDAFYPRETVRLVDLGFMRSQRIVRVEFYPFQYNPVTGALRTSESVRASVRFVGGASASAPVTEPNEWEQSLRELLVNYEAAASFRTQPATAPAAGWTPPTPGYKIAVKDEGIYHLTRAWLAAAGLPVDALDPRTFRMFNNQSEIAIRVVGEADGHFDVGDEVVFYGRDVDTRYTDTNIYWLTYGAGGSAKRMTTRASISNGAAVTSFLTTVKKEDNTTYDSDLPMLPGYDHWFGQQITAAGAGKSGAVNVLLATPQTASTATTAQIDVMLGAVTAGSHRVKLYVNPVTYSTAVFDGTWDGETIFLASATFPQSHLNATGANTVKVEIINDFPGRAADIIRLDWVKLGYHRMLAADAEKLVFDGDGAGLRRYTVTGLSSGNVDVYDVTESGGVVQITGATYGEPTNGVRLFLPLIGKGSKATAAVGVMPPSLPSAVNATASPALQFGDNMVALRRYAVWAPGQLLTPLAISLDAPSNLQATSNAADYIIVTHGEFAAAVQPLADLRAGQGMRVRVVDVQDVYDEFGGGLMSAEAIRDFVAYAYANWTKPAPAYLLLVGDGNYDFRNYKSTARTFVPPYLELVDPDAGETATDNRFVAVTMNGAEFDILPDLHVGRLPANTAAEATIMVNKILAYENKAPRPWSKQVTFVADNLEGGGGDFYAYSDGIADGTALYNGAQVKVLPADYTANKIYLYKTCDLTNPTQSVECRQEIIDKINAGSLLVSYIGHGVKTYWAKERLFDGTSLNSLDNPGRLPVMLPMTCNEGYFIDPDEPSLSELGVRMPDKGVIASWSPTGFGLAPGHDFLERGLFLALFQDGKTLGSAATAGKLYLVANAPAGTFRDLIDTFLLLGDPALHVN